MALLEALIEQGKSQEPLTPEMEDLMDDLQQIFANPVVEAAYAQAIANVDPYIAIEDGKDNPWVGETSECFQAYFRTWFTFLPRPDKGLGRIIPFSYFYLNNPSAYAFLNTFKSRSNPDKPYTREIFDWIAEFVHVRGKFMDSKESKKYVHEWKKKLGHEMEHFIEPKGGYKSFNDFFTRKLKKKKHSNPRPIADPQAESIAVAPADSVLNYIISDLTLTQDLDIKSRQLNVSDLLDNSEYAPCFEGGTAISCVLLPHDYHHFHSPVTGKIIEAVEIKGLYFGVIDGGDFLDDWNFGQGTTDFSVFEDFHRAYYLIETKNHGLVGLVPVGLNTISKIQRSLVCKSDYKVEPGGSGKDVKKGDELGWFQYGGSLNILLFQKGVFPAVSVFMGSRIGMMSEVDGSAVSARKIREKKAANEKPSTPGKITAKKKKTKKTGKKKSRDKGRRKAARAGKSKAT